MFDWATDIHLDHSDDAAFNHFISTITKPRLIITGDIATSHTFEKCITRLQDALKIPIYFVLGNHDFYGSSVYEMRKVAKKYNYLRNKNVALEDTLLIGEDGWADGRAGDFLNSKIMMNDYLMIEDLKNLNPADRLNKLRALSKESNDRIIRKLNLGLKNFDKIILATHVPPFHESCLYNKQKADNEWAPHFINLDLGRRLLKVMSKHPSKKLTVLAGHSHNPSFYAPLPNLSVYVGQASYGSPQIQSFELNI